MCCGYSVLLWTTRSCHYIRIRKKTRVSFTIMGSTQTVIKIDIMMGIFINKSNIYSLCCLYHPWQHSPPPSSHKRLLLLFKNWMHFFVVLLACKSVDRGTVCFIQKMWLGPRIYTPIKLQKMHSILIITFKSHQNLI